MYTTAINFCILEIHPKQPPFSECFVHFPGEEAHITLMTCVDNPGEDPALAVADRALAFNVFLQDLDGA